MIKRWVFRALLKAFTLADCLTSKGRSFQSFGPAMEKAPSSNDLVVVLPIEPQDNSEVYLTSCHQLRIRCNFALLSKQSRLNGMSYRQTAKPRRSCSCTCWVNGSATAFSITLDTKGREVRILLVVCIRFLKSRMQLCHFKGIRHHPRGEGPSELLGTLSNRRRRPHNGNRKRDISLEMSLRMYNTLWHEVVLKSRTWERGVSRRDENVST